MILLKRLWDSLAYFFRRLFINKREHELDEKHPLKLQESNAQKEEKKETLQETVILQEASEKNPQNHEELEKEKPKALDSEEEVQMSNRLPINNALLEEARQRVEVLVVGLMSSDPLEVAQWVPQLRPREEDWEKAFLPHVIPALRAYFGPIFNDDPVPKPKPGQTEVKIYVAQAEHFWDSNPVSDTFSEGMGYIAHLLQPGSVWIDWGYVRPGRKWGLEYNGLVYFPDEGRFAWFPFPFKALKEYYRALPDDTE